jgi:predicted RNase H-like HicB family nuclease
VARTKEPSPAASLKVGDHVASNLPAFSWRGVVVSDHGAIGLDRRQLVTVRVENEEGACRTFDASAENVDRVPAERRFNIVMVAEPEGGYSVFVPELPSVASQGETIAAARANAREAIEDHLKALHDDGLPVPKVQRDRVAARTEW